MSSSTHTWQGYSGPAPLAPYPAHAAPLDGWDVGTMLAGMRDRYLHLTDPAAWPDDEGRVIARHMAAGVKLCLGELESACRRAQERVVELRACCDHEHRDGDAACPVRGCDCDGWCPVAVDA